MSTKFKLPKQLKTTLGVAAALAMGLGMSTNAYAQRDRLSIDTSLGYNVILSDQKTTLRGVSLSFDGGDPYGSITPIMPTQASFDKLATDYGYNFVHVYLEGDAGQNPDPAGINLALADELVAKTKAANLYLMITIGNNGENGAIHSMQKTLDFWSIYAPRYKDETHVIYEAHNEPVAGQNHAWTDTDWDRQVTMYNHIRNLAPNTMIFLGSFMSFNGASSAMYGADYIKNGVGDPNIWNNAAFAWHGYWDLPGIESTINPIEEAGTTYPGLLCTEFWPGDTENGYNAAFETHHMGWAQFQWLNAQDMDLDNLKNKLDNAGTVWKPELASTNWPTAGAPSIPSYGTKIGIYSHFLGGFVNHDNTHMTATATSYTADGNANDGFTIVDAGDGFVALQTASGKYVSATGDGNPLTVTASSIGVNEKWEWMQLCPDQTDSAMTLRPWGGGGHLIGTVERGQNAGKLSANADDASYDGPAEYGFVTAATSSAPQGCDAPPPPAAGPYYGSPMVIPTNPADPHPFNSSAPSNKIWASDFDHGGEGVAYHDIDDENWGGAYRWDVGVDIEAVEGFTNVGWIDPGEWLNYTVDVQQAGDYVLTMRVASAADNGQFHIEMDGVDITGPVITPNTGAWATYQDMQTNVTLQAGVQVMKMVSAGGFNLISFDLQPGTVTPPETGTQMSVNGITMGWTSANGDRVTVHSTTTIVDEHGTPVEGATVTGQWSGLDTGTVSGVTNQSGQVTLSSGAVRSPKGTFTFTVTGVSGSLNYVPANNQENSDSVTF